MSKGNGLGKFFVFCAAVGAAAAGAYYYLSKREAEIADSFDDEDFEDFDEFEDDLEETTDSRFGSRKYVDIKTSDSTEHEATDEKEEKSEAAPERSEEFFDDEDK